MTITLLALAVGLLLGLATGGRPSNVVARPLRALGVLALSVVLQAAAIGLDLPGGIALACILCSYALLVGFAGRNVRLVGMTVVLLGVLLNAAVIAANAGMPVRTEALLAVDEARTVAQLASIDLGAKRHLEDGETRLGLLGDIVPVEPLGEVVSFGDLILAAGIANVVFRLLKPLAPVSRRRRPSVAEVIELLPATAPASLRRSA